MNSTP